MGQLNSLFSYKRFFLKTTVDICDINKDNYKSHLDDVHYRKGHPYNGKCSALIDNKLFLPFLLHEYKELIPQYFYYKDYRGYIKLCNEILGDKIVSSDTIIELIKDKQKVAAKHTYSSGGNGFLVIEYHKGVFYVNNEVYQESQLIKLLNKLNEYIITEYIQQHEYANTINSTSLNTIRLLTYWDYRTNKTELFSGFQRFGCNNSVVDNIGGGNGLLSFIDTEKGTLTGDGEIKTKSTGDHYAENIIHPNSKITLAGVEIPGFHKMVSKVLEIADQNCFLQYIGWDIAITQDSFKIIEMNSLPYLDVVQQRKGFLTNDGLRVVLKR